MGTLAPLPSAWPNAVVVQDEFLFRHDFPTHITTPTLHQQGRIGGGHAAAGFLALVRANHIPHQLVDHIRDINNRPTGWLQYRYQQQAGQPPEAWPTKTVYRAETVGVFNGPPPQGVVDNAILQLLVDVAEDAVRQAGGIENFSGLGEAYVHHYQGVDYQILHRAGQISSVFPMNPAPEIDDLLPDADDLI